MIQFTVKSKNPRQPMIRVAVEDKAEVQMIHETLLEGFDRPLTIGRWCLDEAEARFLVGLLSANGLLDDHCDPSDAGHWVYDPDNIKCTLTKTGR